MSNTVEPGQPDPLILTLELDEATFALLNELRAANFPRRRNLVPAHVTLFHALPGAELERARADLAALVGSVSSLPLALPGPRFMGRGVAFEVISPELVALRGQLAASWAEWLTPQDRQRYRPHITVQNKVEPAVARRLFEDLSASWRPHEGHGVGLLLWHYRGGPWEAAGRFPFGVITHG